MVIEQGHSRDDCCYSNPEIHLQDFDLHLPHPRVPSRRVQSCLVVCSFFLNSTNVRTGKWVGSGMGAHAISQPGREYLCKIIELSLFAADFILSHLLLFLLLPVLCIPLIDKWHSVILFWLRPSRQIRPPIFSMKQNRLRKRIVRRYATLYFIVFIIFVALIVGPLVAGMTLSSHN